MSTATPEHDKLHALDGKNQTCGDFVTWLQHNGYILAKREPANWICEECGPLNVAEAAHSRKGVRFNGLFSVAPMYEHKYCGKAVDHSPEGLYAVPLDITKLLAEYFEIDLQKLEDEKRAILEELRAQQRGGR